MALKFKKRSEKPNLKKVLIYGFDGTGKSTFAYNYCKDNGLNPVVIDIDDTNYTDLPLLEFKRTNDTVLYESLKRILTELTNEDSFDTIILDGVSSLLELLVSNGRGMNKYGDRTTRWNKLLNLMLNSKKHLIFVGQIDMVLIEGESSKAVVNVNSIVNEKYRCIYDGKDYTYEVEKYRTAPNSGKEIPPVEDSAKGNDFVKANEITEDKSSARKKAEGLIKYMRRKNKDMALTNVKLELVRLQREGVYSMEECPAIVKELEILLNSG